jgi:lipoprotein-anchoring transpeptidase ErfK/SrfK
LAARKKRRSNGRKSSSGRWFFRLSVVFLLAAAGFVWWENYHRRTTFKWADLGSWQRWWATNAPTRQAPPRSTNVTSSNVNIPQGSGNNPTNPRVKIDLTIRTNYGVLIETNPPAKEIQNEGIHPVRNLVEAQIALARLGISVGCIDGNKGNQTRSALQAYQIRERNLSVSGDFDEETKEHLRVEEPLFTDYVITADDLARLAPVSETWLGKSEQERLDYETILELLAEKGQASQTFIRNLNPNVSWSRVTAGTIVKIPNIERSTSTERAAFVRINLLHKNVEAFDSKTNLIAHFPCSIAQKVEKRPVGTLYVAKLARNPSYVMDPAVFPESEEAQRIGRKLVIPPGPNNPVGIAWIGLDKPGYGIHGSPKPEQVGRTESHGCFRLANWNAEYLFDLVWVGMPVYVER